MDAKKFNKLIKKIMYSSKAFTEFYKYYYPKIVLYIFRKYRSKDLSEDTAQDFFTKLLKKEIEKYIEHPSAWIYAICDNIAKDYLVGEKNYNLAYVNEEIKTNDNLFEKVLFGEYLKQLEQFDSETREIIMMNVYEGYDLKEISDTLDLNYNTVRQKYSRGIKKVKKF